MRRTVFATVALALVLPLAAQAQDWPPQPAKYTNVAWYTIFNLDFAGPNTEAATNAFMDVFVPAFAASGNPIRAFEHATGEWDITLIMPMKGPADMEWDMSPEISQMLVAAAEAVGLEKMGELAEMMFGAIVRDDVTIVRERKGGSHINENRRAQAGCVLGVTGIPRSFGVLQVARPARTFPLCARLILAA